MPRRHLVTFVSGRLVALVLLFGFQILVARALPAREYAALALVMGLSALVQTAGSFGIARVSARYLSQVDRGVSRHAARRLTGGLLALRAVGSVVTIVLPCALMLVFSPAFRASGLPLIIAGAGYVAASAFQYDLDGMAQALMLQPASRAVAIGEPLLRLLAVLALLASPYPCQASGVLGISVLTSASACALLAYVVVRALQGEAEPGAAGSPLVWSEVGRLALGGYASTLAWFATSPAIVRVWASRILQIASFAGFSFAQSLVVSLQRYTPGFMLFPFIEPTVMRGATDGSDGDRLGAIVSLTVKIDLVVIGGAVVGCFISARQIVGLLAGGKYVDQADALPWLLMVVVANSLYRGLEIAAVKVGVGHRLVRMLPVSILWLGLMAVCGSRFGLWPLLIAPLADAGTRLFLLYRIIFKGSGVRAIDARNCLTVCVCVALFSGVGHYLAKFLNLNSYQTIGFGVVFGIGYFLAVMKMRPLTRREAGLLQAFHPILDRAVPYVMSRA
jgi:O-antigen/teichoic acid export membrane protein